MALKLNSRGTLESASELARRISNREVSPVEVADAFLRRIEGLNPRLNAFVTVAPDRVLEDARAAERELTAGGAVGPLHGVPVAVKDLEDTRGLRTTYGSLAYRDNVPDADSIVVERIRGAGGIVLGKTNTPAFGLLGETKNRLGEHCRNPWDESTTTGGSSGGSAAAVAAGLAPVATGTDSAGSITCPAGMCGVFGIKPTHGRVPMYPNFGDSLTFNDAGPLSRTVADAALMLAVLAGHDPRDPVSLRHEPPDFLDAVRREPAALRIAYSPDLGHCAVDLEVVDVTRRASRVFAELGSTVEEATPAIEDPWVSYTPIYASDAQTSLGDYFRDHRHDLFPETIREIEGMDRITGAEVAAAWGRLRRFRADMAAFFERFDLLLTPATAVTAFPVGQPPDRIGGTHVVPGWKSFMPFQIPWNMTGQPVASVPCGRDPRGLPVGLLIVGPRYREDLVLSAAGAFEQARPWSDRLPPAITEPA